ncbi:MAG TPA: A/G-specific adenine glycosylase [Rhodoplanes sp.]|nr:A/G-specific adenine glycosylase [Rhodoplanes sp.]
MRTQEAVQKLGRRLLAWYDRNRRVLPWRAVPGEPSDPYRVWLSEIMLQQTTVAATIPYYLRFLARFPTVHALAAADLEDVLRLWAGLGYYARARNLHACARTVVDRHGGEFPQAAAELRDLPGIGDYTAAAVAAIAYEARTVPVDGNVERVVARLFAIGEALPRGKAVIRAAAERLAPERRSGDFAQALMDLGATLCTPKNPACSRCPLRADCAAATRGDAEAFPVKETKRQGRLRRGAAFVLLRHDGFVLVRTRPANGLLGGMTEVPTSEWTHAFDEQTAFAHAPILPRATGEGNRPSRASLRSLCRLGCVGGGRGDHIPSPLTPSTMLRMVPLPRSTGEDAHGSSAQSPTANHTDFLPNKEHEIIWRRVPGVVRHVFTHFPLELFVFVADAPGGLAAPAGMRWTPLADLDGEALSDLMRKVLAHARRFAEGRVKIVETERATVTAAPRAPRRAARRSR